MDAEFLALVMLMRRAQARYFRERSQAALREAKHLESRVDSLAEIMVARLDSSDFGLFTAATQSAVSQAQFDFLKRP